MGDAEADDVLGGAAGEGGAFEFDRAGRAHHVADRPQRGGLAGAVGPEQRRHAAFAEIEGEAMQRLDLAVIGAQVLYIEHHRHWSLLPR